MDARKGPSPHIIERMAKAIRVAVIRRSDGMMFGDWEHTPPKVKSYYLAEALAAYEAAREYIEESSVL